jgi:hypothetical protein
MIAPPLRKVMYLNRLKTARSPASQKKPTPLPVAALLPAAVMTPIAIGGITSWRTIIQKWKDI